MACSTGNLGIRTLLSWQWIPEDFCNIRASLVCVDFLSEPLGQDRARNPIPRPLALVFSRIEFVGLA